MLSELADVKFENKLAEVELLLSGTEINSVLCCAAKSEDKYGVVQLVLPEILNAVSSTIKSIDTV